MIQDHELLAAAAMVALKCITPREAYGALDPALLMTFACLVPLSKANASGVP